MKNQFLIGALLLLFGASLGVGGMQFAFTGDVREVKVRIDSQDKTIGDERQRTDARIFELTALVRTVIDNQRDAQKNIVDLIDLLKVQNEVMREQSDLLRHRPIPPNSMVP